MGVLQSGLVVSGNSYITVTRQATSGDALMTLRVSGNTDLIAFRLARNETRPLVGGAFNEVADHVDAEVYIHGTYTNTSGAMPILQQRINDLKVTIASGNWTQSGVPPPQLMSEGRPYVFEKFAREALRYKVRYLL